jgi:hypothetical protein
MHITEGRMSKQLEMKLNVIEKAVQQLINISSGLAIENQKLNHRVDQLSKNVAFGGGGSADNRSEVNEDIDLNITNVQKILKQQQSLPTQNGFGRKIVNN